MHLCEAEHLKKWMITLSCFFISSWLTPWNINGVNLIFRFCITSILSMGKYLNSKLCPCLPHYFSWLIQFLITTCYRQLLTQTVFKFRNTRSTVGICFKLLTNIFNRLSFAIDYRILEGDTTQQNTVRWTHYKDTKQCATCFSGHHWCYFLLWRLII